MAPHAYCERVSPAVADGRCAPGRGSVTGTISRSGSGALPARIGVPEEAAAPRALPASPAGPGEAKAPPGPNIFEHGAARQPVRRGSGPVPPSTAGAARPEAEGGAGGAGGGTPRPSHRLTAPYPGSSPTALCLILRAVKSQGSPFSPGVRRVPGAAEPAAEGEAAAYIARRAAPRGGATGSAARATSGCARAASGGEPASLHPDETRWPGCPAGSSRYPPPYPHRPPPRRAPRGVQGVAGPGPACPAGRAGLGRAGRRFRCPGAGPLPGLRLPPPSGGRPTEAPGRRGSERG